ncbi:hypothetical protein EXIGLDRAFT_676605 [Exidia glandulosa HHB12029]|uniref:Capsular associated protein n=1 Tax=Exidia glandulosa HHB12029 TaxID=1314781 RepID=A0A165GSB1_EXIGL|nr:hypothetical protein EXIGLDRAFT_676605 [Exidia glandulosa HHB12029]
MQRRGSSTRVWLGLVGLAALFYFFFPSSYSYSPYPRHQYTQARELHPVNYLRNLTKGDVVPPPFDFCPVFGPGDRLGLKYGSVALGRSRLYTGTNTRVQRVIHKALSGLPVTISVLGGSVSACHGAGDDPIAPRCYPARFFSWWNDVFPHPASELTNGAMRRTDSAYFSFCHALHLPDQTDLVVLEFDAEDPNDPAWIDHFELLVRSILVRRDQPAVIILGHFSPQIQGIHGFAGPELLHTLVAQYYDVPHISIKGMLYNSYVKTPELVKKYYADPVLANNNGHELIADTLIAYFQAQVCAGWSSATGQSYDALPFPLGGEMGVDPSPADARGIFGGVGLRRGDAGKNGEADAAPPADGAEGALHAGEARAGDQPAAGVGVPNANAYGFLGVPQARMNDRPSDAERFREVEPFCVSANDLVNPLPPSLFYGSGWLAYHPAKGPAGALTLDESRHYWYSTLPTSKLRVQLKVGSGDIAIYFLMEPRSAGGKLNSEVRCWVDDNVKGAKTINNAGAVDRSTPSLVMIDHGVTRGSHFVECTLEGDEGKPVAPFKILGIFTT